MWRERAAQGVASYVFVDTGLSHGLLDGPLEDRLMHMVPALFGGPQVLPAVFLGEEVIGICFSGARHDGPSSGLLGRRS